MASVQKKSISGRIFNIVNCFIVTLLIFVTLYPMLYVIFASLSEPRYLLSHEGLLLYPVGKMTLKGYELVLKNPNIINGFRNSIFYVALGTSINVILTSMGAFVLTRKHFAIRRLCSLLILLTMFFSGGMIPTFFVVKNLGLYDSFWALVLPNAISVYNMIIMRTFFFGIPESLEESANLEGANDWQVFTRIILPLSMPVIAVMILYYGVGHWNAWFGAMIYLRDRTKYPLQLFLREILLQDQMESMAVSTQEMAEESLFKELIQYSSIIVTTLPILCIYPLLQRYFVQGVMIGAVKG
ncbi:MAG: carbohydrate ABC transporter permease [Clostridiales bacterium]|nr:carbohydrate ABC transporter permease [Clostridiales bacterium]